MNRPKACSLAIPFLATCVGVVFSQTPPDSIELIRAANAASDLSKIGPYRLDATVVASNRHLPVVVDDAPSAQQLIDTAHKAADLSVLGPYVLTARVVLGAGSKKEHAGHLTIYRDGTNRRTDLDVEGVKDFRVTQDQKRYLDPNRDLLAVTRLERIDQSWDPEAPPVPTMFGRRQGAPLGSVRQDNSNRPDAWCVDKESETSCFNAATGLLVRTVSMDETQIEFQDFAAVGAVQFPRRIAIHRPGFPTIELQDIEVKGATPPADIFATPRDATELETCKAGTLPKVVYHPEPEFSDKARHKRTEGTVLLDVVINKEGNVGVVWVLTPRQDDLDKQARKKVATWRFRPADCDGHPVNVETTIEVSFHLR